MAEFDQDGSDRTEAATPKKRDESRRKGSVAKSAEVNSAMILLAGIMLLQAGGGLIVSRMSELARSFFRLAGTATVTEAAVQQWIIQIVIFILLTVGPVVLGLAVVGTMASAAQVGLHFYWEILTPKFSKFNPLSGIKRLLFSKHSAVELAKGLFKFSVIGLVGYFAVSGIIEDSVELMDSDAASVVGFMAASAASAATKMSLVFLVIAGLDYAFQRHDHEEMLKMTKQEVKEEGKMTEGDPVNKGRIRSIQRQIAYRRMMVDVPKADVVVTNPTHVAVALKYSAVKMNAPRVVAKGAELIAKRIKEIALQHHVPILEDRMLARTLYKTVDVGREVPEKLFHAVAQVLAYIYRMKNAAKARL